MKRSQKIATGIALSLSLGLASAVYAQPGQMGGGMGPGAQGGMQHGMKGGMEHGGMRGNADSRGHGPQGMTSEERAAFREKMQNATPEERRKLADARRAEMHRRMQERGGMQHEHRGGAAQQDAPTTSEHSH